MALCVPSLTHRHENVVVRAGCASIPGAGKQAALIFIRPRPRPSIPRSLWEVGLLRPAACSTPYSEPIAGCGFLRPAGENQEEIANAGVKSRHLISSVHDDFS